MCAVSSGGLQLAVCPAVRLGRPLLSRLAFFYLCVFSANVAPRAGIHYSLLFVARQ